MLTALLEEASYEVHEANGGADAARICESVEPDVVLLDLVMPEVDGFEFLAELRAGPRAAPPVVVITQYDDAANRQRALALGATGYVGKSLALERGFANTLREWVDQFRLR